MIDQIQKADCTGCKMCADLCPASAITFPADERGFWYPAVDQEKCLQCGACIRTCPSLSGFKTDKAFPVVYAAWSKDDEVRMKSTSGGLFCHLAESCISRGGFLAGCCYEEGYKRACHRISSREEDLKAMMGSKYLQSDTAGIYQQVRSMLEEGNEVLFSGTPCQSAALQSFLGRRHPKLFTVDFICKGINSPLIYERYLSELEDRYGSSVQSVRMKSKRTGWRSLGIEVEFQDGQEYFREGKEDLWVRGYVEGNLFTRDSCSNCRYKELPRISDITLGDFWGVRWVRKADLFKGVSLMLINSPKGGELLRRIMPEIHYNKRSLRAAIMENPFLIRNNDKKNESEMFFERLESMKVSEAIESCLNHGREPR